jgi:hypothetical protein
VHTAEELEKDGEIQRLKQDLERKFKLIQQLDKQIVELKGQAKEAGKQRASLPDESPTPLLFENNPLLAPLIQVRKLQGEMKRLKEEHKSDLQVLVEYVRRKTDLPPQPNIKERIIFDFVGQEISVDDKRYPLTGTAAKLFKILLQHPGEWKSDKEIGAGERTDKILNKMTDCVKSIFEHGRKGYRISREVCASIHQVG